MSEHALHREEGPDGIPVPLIDPRLDPSDEIERPVELSAGPVREAERILEAPAGDSVDEGVSEPLQVAPGQPGPPQQPPTEQSVRGMHKWIAGALLVLACTAAFTHGWRVGSGRSDARTTNQHSETVTDITDKDGRTR